MIEACGIVGQCRSWSAKARRTTCRVTFVGLYYRGQRRPDGDRREYLDVYHPINEGIPRLRQGARLPIDGDTPQIAGITAEELQCLACHGPRHYAAGQYQQGLNVRLAGPGGSPMTWCLGDPIASEGWGSSQIAMVRRLTPHIRQFIRVRQALVRAQAGDTTVTALLDNPLISVLHLDRRGRILVANDAGPDARTARLGCQFIEGVTYARVAGIPGPVDADDDDAWTDSG